MQSEEPFDARERRVQELRAEVEAGAYRPAGEEVANAMLQPRPPVLNYHLAYLRNLNRAGQRRITTLFAGESCTFWVQDSMTADEEDELRGQFWTAWNAEARRNAEGEREWRVKVAELSAQPLAPVSDAEKAQEYQHLRGGNFERVLRHEALVLIVTVFVMLAAALSVCWWNGWWLR